MATVARRRAIAQPRIVHNPKVCGGEPTIAGTRVPVRSVVLQWQYHHDVDRVLQAFPRLDADAVEQALAYYRDHPDEIHRAIEENERIAYATDL